MHQRAVCQNKSARMHFVVRQCGPRAVQLRESRFLVGVAFGSRFKGVPSRVALQGDESSRLQLQWGFL